MSGSHASSRPSTSSPPRLPEGLRPRVAVVALALAPLCLAPLAPAAAQGAAGADAPTATVAASPATAAMVATPSLDVPAPAPLASGGRWEQLSDAQKRAVRALYDGLGDADEPPYPRRGLASIYRELGELQRKLGLEGDLALTVQVDARGSPQQVAVYRTAEAGGVPDPYFVQVAAYVLMHSDYKPARCGGQPCAMDFRFDYRSAPR